MGSAVSKPKQIWSLGDSIILESRKQKRGYVLWTCLFFLLVTIIYGWPILFGGQALAGGDIINSYLPYKFLAKQQLLHGEFPHWNPLVFCGRPLQADIQVGLFYPPNLLFWFLPLEWTFNLTTLFHFWIGGVGMALWMRRRVVRTAAAWLAGVLFMFSGYATTRLMPGIVVFHSAMAWLPWLLLCWDRLTETFASDRPRRRGGAVAALVFIAVLEMLAGAPQIAFYSFLCLGLYAIIFAWRGRADATSEDEEYSASPWGNPREWVAGLLPLQFSRVLPLALVLCLGAGICAVQLLPTSMLIGQSWDRAVGASWDYIVDGSLHPRMLLTFAAPFFFGDPLSEELYWGGTVGYFETTAYATALPLFLLAFFLAVRWGAMRRVWLSDLSAHGQGDAVRFEIFLLSLLGLAVLLSFGRYSPFFWLSYHMVPGFDRFRVPGRMLLFYLLGISALSSWAVDRLAAGNFGNARILRIRRSAAGRVILLVGIIGAALGLLLYRLVPGLLVFFKMPFAPFAGSLTDPRAQAAAFLEAQAGRSVLFFLGEWILAGILVLVASGFLCNPFRAGRFRHAAQNHAAFAHRGGHESEQRSQVIQGIALWLMVFGCLGVLLPYGLHFMTREPLAGLADQKYPRTERVAFLQDALKKGGRFLWFDSLLSYEVDQFQPELLTNRPMMHGLQGLRGYDPINSRRYGLYINRLTGQPPWKNPRAFMFVPDAPEGNIHWGLLELLDTRVTLSYAGMGSAAVEEARRWTFQDASLPAAAQMRAYGLKNPAGAAWLSAPFVVDRGTPLEEILALMGSSEFDPKSMVVLESPPLLPNSEDSKPAVGSAGRVELISRSSGSRVFAVSTSRPAMLVVSESYYPGWRARVDGIAVPVVPGNVALCAIAVPGGNHMVEMRYRPREFYQGAVISLCSLALFALFWARSRRRA